MRTTVFLTAAKKPRTLMTLESSFLRAEVIEEQFWLCRNFLAEVWRHVDLNELAIRIGLCRFGVPAANDVGSRD
jgi:hypothetical protein